MGPAYVLEAAIQAVDEANPGCAESFFQVRTRNPCTKSIYLNAAVPLTVDGEKMYRQTTGVLDEALPATVAFRQPTAAPRLALRPANKSTCGTNSGDRDLHRLVPFRFALQPRTRSEADTPRGQKRKPAEVVPSEALN